MTRIILIGILVTVLTYTVHILTAPSDMSERIIEDRCREYEASGAIPIGSCDCAEVMFPNWNSSYDWMDACQILKGR